MKNYLTFIIAICATGFLSVNASAQLVTSAADDNTDGTLRQEISDTPEGGEITFAAGIDMIILNSEIIIDKELTITGPAGNVLIDADSNGRAFHMISGTVTISNLDIVNGLAADGGAIFIEDADLIMSNSSISNSVANGASGSGGGIFLSTNSSLNMTDCQFASNLANRAGGAIEDNSGEGLNIILNNGDFIANNAGVAPAIAAPGNGGAIHITTPGEIEINGGTAVDNIAAAEGGGFWNNAGTMTVDGTSFDGNIGSGPDADNGGGALFNNGGTMVVMNITANDNIADGAAGSGGAILNAGGMLSVSGSSFSGNSAQRAGGAIEDASAEGGMLMLTDNDFLGNTVAMSPGNGGALHVGGPGDSNISGGMANDNTAGQEGGAFWNNTGTMTVDGTSFEGNIGSGPAADDGGGALFNNGGTMIVTNITADNNIADGAAGSGGAILNAGGMLSVSGSSFSG
ncbi:MAG: T9SS C-terminal target domain-containing protein, partial [Cryomorphaceae bacterium]